MLHPARYPGTGWIRLDRDVLQQLADYRTRHGLTTWDETVTALLSGLSEASGGGR